jgi:hypothetical protein
MGRDEVSSNRANTTNKQNVIFIGVGSTRFFLLIGQTTAQFGPKIKTEAMTKPNFNFDPTEPKQ